MELIVLGLKKLNFPKVSLVMLIGYSVIIGTGSFTICGLINSVDVNYGYPKSIISSNISYIKTKFFLIDSSLNTPQKSLIILTTL